MLLSVPPPASHFKGRHKTHIIHKRGLVFFVSFVPYVAIIKQFFAPTSDLWLSSASSACTQRLRVDPRVQGVVSYLPLRFS